MSAQEALTARLADLESDSFQLKLRNYYLERRVSKELAGPTSHEDALDEKQRRARDAVVLPHTRRVGAIAAEPPDSPAGGRAAGDPAPPEMTQLIVAEPDDSDFFDDGEDDGLDDDLDLY